MALALRGITHREVGMSVGEMIKRLRLERGVSQLELARVASLTVATLNRLEQEKVSVTIKTLQKILDVFGLEIAFKRKE